MKKVSVLKAFFISSFVAGALASSASAACVADLCKVEGVGIGGAWIGYDKNVNNESVSSWVGYISTTEKLVYWNRMQSSFDLRLGLGQQSIASKTHTNWLLQGTARVGGNVATPTIPLFINIFGDVDSSLAGISRTNISFGLELETEVSLGAASIFLSAGYGLTRPIYVGDYGDGREAVASKAFGSVIIASAGVAFNVFSNYELFVKASGRYYNLKGAGYDNTFYYPKASNFTVMAEIGLRGVSGYTRSN